jgi:DNA helicase-2/ATP-dependent DNA helicase PcrA
MSDIPLDDAKLWQVEKYGHEITDSVAFHGPPGTGKTTTAAATVGRLLRDHDYDINDVAWVTYRRSLARDTLERLATWDVVSEDQLNEPSKGATRYISTAHAVGNRCADIGEQPVESWQRNDFCQRMGMQFFTSEPWEDSAGKLLFKVLDYLANANVTPENTQAVHNCPYISDLREHWRGDLVDAWYQWEDYKAQRDLIDFHEMLKRPLEQGATPGRRILVVDEYHDVTGLMHALFEMWMDDAEIVLVAGDPNQVVNAFDGASPKYFESLDLPTVLLPKSWRCRKNHWDVATGMLAKAHEVPDVETKGYDEASQAGLVRDYNSPRYGRTSENGWVQLPSPTEPASPGWILGQHEGSTLFLSRTQVQADGVGAALERAGIPYRSQTDLKGWNTDKGQKRLAVHNGLQKIKGFTPADFGAGMGLSKYSEGNQDPQSVSLEAEEAATLLDAVRASTLSITRSEAEDQGEALRQSEEPITLRDFNEFVDTKFWERYTAGASSVERLNKSTFGSNSDRELEAVKNALLNQDGPVSPDDIDTWSITIHASKGMEADDVVVYDGISSRIRAEMRSDEITRKNEYRTWYVALSRAKKRLHVMRNAFEWTNPILPQPLGGE